MKAKTFKKASDKESVRELLQTDAPMVVRFYNKTCPACRASESTWKDFCSEDRPYLAVAIEEVAIPDEVLSSIKGFPTYAKHDRNGNAHVVGVQVDLVKSLRLID
jgi:deoxycytidine triphosphate deaminase